MGTTPPPSFGPPPTPVRFTEQVLHGVSIHDPYQWLEQQSDPDVVEWTRQQHDATMQYIEATMPEIEGLREEIALFLDRDVEYPPFYKADREFFYRRLKGAHQATICTRIGTEVVSLFDPESIDPTGATSISFFTPNSDGSRAALGYQNKGTELNDVRFIDTLSGEFVGEELCGVMNVTWARDERYCFYTERTKDLIELQQPLRVYLHELGTERSSDTVLMNPADAKDYAYAFEPEEADVRVEGLMMNQGGWLRLTDKAMNKQPVVVYDDDRYLAYPIFRGRDIYWFTNYNAPNFQLLHSSLDDPEFSRARTLIPESNLVLADCQLTRQYIVVRMRDGVLNQLKLYTLLGEFVRDLEVPERADVGSMSYHRQSDCLYVSLNTFANPGRLYRLNASTFEWTLVWRDDAHVDMSDLVSELQFCESSDGTRVPLFLTYMKSVDRNGKQPTLLTGYGGFNLGISVGYVANVASFLKRGGLWVNAGLRGGNEYGESWHKAGMRHNKQNTFNDFFATAEFLIRQNYTSPEHLVIKGGSNGGLLIGAAITQRPELFKAAVCEVPLLDMLRYHKFKIARYWITEYGNAENEADFSTLHSYSPYHRIQSEKNLPITLVTVGEFDSRVDPLHGKKFIAAAQNNPGQTNPVMLWVDFNAGHQGGRPTNHAIDDAMLRWKFIMGVLGMK